MNIDEKIKEIERIKTSLEHHFQRYNDYKYDSKNKSRAKERSKAYDDMYTHAQYIKDELHNPLVSSEISNGAQFQFEDFHKYVDSDFPDYLKTIEALLERLKLEKNKE